MLTLNEKYAVLYALKRFPTDCEGFWTAWKEKGKTVTGRMPKDVREAILFGCPASILAGMRGHISQDKLEECYFELTDEYHEAALSLVKYGLHGLSYRYTLDLANPKKVFGVFLKAWGIPKEEINDVCCPEIEKFRAA